MITDAFFKKGEDNIDEYFPSNKKVTSGDTFQHRRKIAEPFPSLARGADRQWGCKENRMFSCTSELCSLCAPYGLWRRTQRKLFSFLAQEICPKFLCVSVANGRPHQGQGKAQGEKRPAEVVGLVVSGGQGTMEKPHMLQIIYCEESDSTPFPHTKKHDS